MTDEAVLKRLTEHIGARIDSIYGRRGKDHLARKLPGFNNAARFARWVVLMDLDDPRDCAPNLRRILLPTPARFMQLRIAVREVEAWLLADGERFARFFAVRKASIPGNPETLDDPKRAVVEIVASSKSRSIREDMLPRPGSGRAIGPAYVSRLMEFALDTQKGWRPDVAALTSDSLKRCLAAIQALAAVQL